MSLSYTRVVPIVRFALAISVAVFLCVSQAKANPITFDFAGTFTFGSPALNPPFGSGQTISGFYTFESTTTGAPIGPGQVTYVNTITAFGFTSGSYTGGFSGQLQPGPLLGPPFNNISITNSSDDRYNFNVSFTGASIGGMNPGLFEIILEDPSGTAFGTTTLPLVPPNLTLFAAKQINLHFASAITGSIASFNVTSLTLQPATIAEPTTLFLLLSGISGLFALKMRNWIGRVN